MNGNFKYFKSSFIFIGISFKLIFQIGLMLPELNTFANS